MLYVPRPLERQIRHTKGGGHAGQAVRDRGQRGWGLSFTMPLG